MSATAQDKIPWPSNAPPGSVSWLRLSSMNRSTWRCAHAETDLRILSPAPRPSLIPHQAQVFSGIREDYTLNYMDVIIIWHI